MSSLAVVSVRAFPRQGYDGFCRGGRRWSVAPTLAKVTPALLAVLKAEPLLAVDGAPNLSGVDVDVLPEFDVPAQPYLDAGAQALDAARKLDAEIAVLQAQVDLEEKRRKADALRAQLSSKAEKKPEPLKK